VSKNQALGIRLSTWVGESFVSTRAAGNDAYLDDSTKPYANELVLILVSQHWDYTGSTPAEE